MGMVTDPPKRKKRKFLSRSILAFIAHQFVGTWGVALLAPWVFAFTVDLIPRFSDRVVVTQKGFHWLLTGTPYYPFQIGLGLFLGWALWRRFHNSSMFWVWVIPLLILVYCLIFVPTLLPDFTPMMFWAGAFHSRFSHYFGHGCSGHFRCLDQLLVTMPFYAASAYSIGALDLMEFLYHGV